MIRRKAPGSVSDRDLKVKFAVQRKDPIKVSVTCYSFHANDFSREFMEIVQRGKPEEFVAMFNTV